MAGRGDRLVLRSYSPAVTIAGAVVVDPLAGEAAPRERGRPSPRRGGRRRWRRCAWWRRRGRRASTRPTLAARVTVPLPALLAAPAGPRRRRGLRPRPGDARGAGRAGRPGRGRGGAAARLPRRRAASKAGMPREELRRRVFARAPGRRVRGRPRRPGARGTCARVRGDGGPGRSRRAVHPRRSAAFARRCWRRRTRRGWRAWTWRIPPPGLAADARLLEKMARSLVAEGALRRVGDVLVESARLDALQAEVRRRWAAGHPPGRGRPSRT